MNFIITSEHRVGSRWVHYLLADIFGKKVSPEIDGSRLVTDAKGIVASLFKNNKIPKFHRALPEDIFKHIGGKRFRIIGVVRNPRDRAISYAFHNRFHNKTHFKEKDFETDLESIKYVLYDSYKFKSGTDRQFEMMTPGFSTRDSSNITKDVRYIWTTYHWLKEDINREINTILDFLSLESREKVNKIIIKNSFKKKSSRDVGKEDRRDIWRRKGIESDWENWFNDDMINDTEEIDKIYWDIVNKENVNNNI